MTQTNQDTGDDKQANQVVPFSTSLPPELKRKIKLFALGLGLKDREIVEQALNEYFERHSSENPLHK